MVFYLHSIILLDKSTMAPSASSKRKLDSQTNPASIRSTKRFKTNNARTILTQSTEKALNKNGNLDVGAFVKAREFEIKAMTASMGASKTALSKRAFQQVPRDMRRRTASHNVKRVPKRMQARATREVRIGELQVHSHGRVEAD